MRQIFLFIIISSFIEVFAQTTLIKGVVRDSKSNETLIGVNVSTEDSTIGSTTDVDGKYELFNE